MRAALNTIQAKASQIDPGLGNVFAKVFDWLPELFDRAAFEVALEELDPNYEAWASAEKPGSEKVVKQVLERREALYNGVERVIKSLAFGGSDA